MCFMSYAVIALISIFATGSADESANIMALPGIPECSLLSIWGNPHYYKQEVAGWGWIVRPCAPGSGFSKATCSCSRRILKTDDVCNRLPYHWDIRYYHQLVNGHGWLFRPCGLGTGFNPSTCDCAFHIKSTNYSPDFYYAADKPKSATAA